jgi:hypothetical protein
LTCLNACGRRRDEFAADPIEPRVTSRDEIGLVEPAWN